MKVFEMISKHANDLLAESIKSLKRKPSKYTKPITPINTITYLAMRLSLTWKDAKTTIQQKYKSCKESWWIGYNRFSVISNFAIANLYKLRDMLNSAYLLDPLICQHILLLMKHCMLTKVIVRCADIFRENHIKPAT